MSNDRDQNVNTNTITNTNTNTNTNTKIQKIQIRLLFPCKAFTMNHYNERVTATRQLCDYIKVQ